MKQELGKITYFSTEVSFAAMINKLNEMIRYMLFADITENQFSNLVLFHKKAIFQMVLISTSRKTHAQECAKITLENMGNNEEKNQHFIEINSYRAQPSSPRRETPRKHSVPELRR